MVGLIVHTPLLSQVQCLLAGDNLHGLRALGAVSERKLDLLAFLERTITLTRETSEMHKDIGAILARDEAKALGRVKPLDGALLAGAAIRHWGRRAGPARAETTIVSK